MGIGGKGYSVTEDGTYLSTKTGQPINPITGMPMNIAQDPPPYAPTGPYADPNWVPPPTGPFADPNWVPPPAGDPTAPPPVTEPPPATSGYAPYGPFADPNWAPPPADTTAPPPTTGGPFPSQPPPSPVHPLGLSKPTGWWQNRRNSYLGSHGGNYGSWRSRQGGRSGRGGRDWDRPGGDGNGNGGVPAGPPPLPTENVPTDPFRQLAYNQMMGNRFYGGVIPEALRSTAMPGDVWGLLNSMGIQNPQNMTPQQAMQQASSFGVSPFGSTVRRG